VFLEKDLIFQDLGDKMAVWNPRKKETLILNNTAWYILSLIDLGINSVEDIAKNLAKEYEIDLETAKKDTMELIEELLKAGIIWKEG
jgi:Coenzyme PQQ synthesis protein D (PqqD).